MLIFLLLLQLTVSLPDTIHPALFDDILFSGIHFNPAADRMIEEVVPVQRKREFSVDGL